MKCQAIRFYYLLMVDQLDCGDRFFYFCDVIGDGERAEEATRARVLGVHS